MSILKHTTLAEMLGQTSTQFSHNCHLLPVKSNSFGTIMSQPRESYESCAYPNPLVGLILNLTLDPLLFSFALRYSSDAPSSTESSGWGWGGFLSSISTQVRRDLALQFGIEISPQLSALFLTHVPLIRLRLSSNLTWKILKSLELRSRTIQTRR